MKVLESVQVSPPSSTCTNYNDRQPHDENNPGNDQQDRPNALQECGRDVEGDDSRQNADAGPLERLHDTRWPVATHYSHRRTQAAVSLAMMLANSRVR